MFEGLYQRFRRGVGTEVSLAEMADLAAEKFVGRALGAGTGIPQALTDEQARLILTQKGADVASANPLVLGTDGIYFDVTGTTGFASITVAAEKFFVLQFDGALTMTHHATNLVLPGAADITTAAGDRAICYAEAANQVRVIEYVRAGFAPIAIASTAWTPVVTFATPGDLSVAYTHQAGRYVRIGPLIIAEFSIQTSTFTHTTASGSLLITGAPVAHMNVTGLLSGAALADVGGITKANYTQFMALFIGNTATMTIRAAGSGQTTASVGTADVPTGGTVTLRGCVSYLVA